ncbi:hypothetical protein BD414DRAFT_38906 [Trametes punicea]|nr:hypothetical protein BD414DRAFT_38906 [Trametes punicea]
MPTFACGTCAKAFKSESARTQHCKDKVHRLPQVEAANAPKPSAAAGANAPKRSAAAGAKAAKLSVPFQCQPCCLAFTDKGAYDEHVLLVHPPPKPVPKYECLPCGIEFSSAEALSIHYRHLALHPKCPICDAAFVDQTQLNLHKVAHENKFMCGPCGREIRVLERQKHYEESPNHPVCFVCGKGFYDDADQEKHFSSAHLETRCSRCKRQFRSSDELQSHYLTSPMHPHCAICEIGFMDDIACDKHMEISHPRPPPRAPRTTPPPPVVSSTVPPSSLEVQQSARSSPLSQQPALSDVGQAAVGKEASASDGDSYDTVAASSQAQRAVSEPTIPTVLVAGVSSSTQAAGSFASRSPTISERSLDDMVRGRDVTRHLDSESTFSLRSVSASSIRSYVCVPVADTPGYQTTTTATTAAPIPQPFWDRPSSGFSKREASMPTTPVHSVQTIPKPSEGVPQQDGSRASSRLATMPSASSILRSSISRPSSPARVRSPLPVRSTASRSLSRVSTLSANSQAVGSPSQRPSVTAVEPPLSSDTEGTNETPASTPKLKAVARPQGKAGTISWHCRSCMQEPCVAPTATMCGHIFCTACILQELAKTGACPVCGKLILLRLHVESD